MDNEAMRIANEQPNSNMIFSAQEVFFRIDLKKKKNLKHLWLSYVTSAQGPLYGFESTPSKFFDSLFLEKKKT